MNDINHYLDEACRQVNGQDALRAHLGNELKERLEEAIDALVAEGMSDDDAAAKAIEDLGDPEIIRDGMQSVLDRASRCCLSSRPSNGKTEGGTFTHRSVSG